MGLDMFLMRKIKIKDNVDSEEKEDSEVEVGYWRKANQIHRWFVDNVQDGIDNCGEYPVTKEQLNDLLNVIKVVLKASKLVEGEIVDGYGSNGCGDFEPNLIQGKIIQDPTVAKKLLPTQEGFFFGHYGYDQYYIDDLKDTKKIIKAINKLYDEAEKEEDIEIFYTSSW